MGEKKVTKLKKLREKAGLTQKDLASAVGRQQTFIAKIESGTTDINNITMITGYNLSQVLDCSMEDLVDKRKAKKKCNKKCNEV